MGDRTPALLSDSIPDSFVAKSVQRHCLCPINYRYKNIEKELINIENYL